MYISGAALKDFGVGDGYFIPSPSRLTTESIRLLPSLPARIFNFLLVDLRSHVGEFAGQFVGAKYSHQAIRVGETGYHGFLLGCLVTISIVFRYIAFLFGGFDCARKVNIMLPACSIGIIILGLVGATLNLKFLQNALYEPVSPMWYSIGLYLGLIVSGSAMLLRLSFPASLLGAVFCFVVIDPLLFISAPIGLVTLWVLYGQGSNFHHI